MSKLVTCQTVCFLCSSVMAGLSSYALRMARLSSQIFGEVVHPTDPKSMKVVQLFQEPPMAKRREVYDWYPHHKIYYAVTQKLRFMGLFRYSRIHLWHEDIIYLCKANMASFIFTQLCCWNTFLRVWRFITSDINIYFHFLRDLQQKSKTNPTVVIFSL